MMQEACSCKETIHAYRHWRRAGGTAGTCAARFPRSRCRGVQEGRRSNAPAREPATDRRRPHQEGTELSPIGGEAARNGLAPLRLIGRRRNMIASLEEVARLMQQHNVRYII